ncbi:hypothetical protein D3C80_2087570 [compost metagenome]
MQIQHSDQVGADEHAWDKQVDHHRYTQPLALEQLQVEEWRWFAPAITYIQPSQHGTESQHPQARNALFAFAQQAQCNQQQADGRSTQH